MGWGGGRPSPRRGPLAPRPAPGPPRSARGGARELEARPRPLPLSRRCGARGARGAAAGAWLPRARRGELPAPCPRRDPAGALAPGPALRGPRTHGMLRSRPTAPQGPGSSPPPPETRRRRGSRPRLPDAAALGLAELSEGLIRRGGAGPSRAARPRSRRPGPPGHRPQPRGLAARPGPPPAGRRPGRRASRPGPAGPGCREGGAPRAGR